MVTEVRYLGSHAAFIADGKYLLDGRTGGVLFLRVEERGNRLAFPSREDAVKFTFVRSAMENFDTLRVVG